MTYRATARTAYTLAQGEQEALLEWARGDDLSELAMATMKTFPPGTVVVLEDGRDAYVVGYADEEPALDLSFVNPGEDYQGAIDSVFSLCSRHVRPPVNDPQPQ